MLGVEPSLPAYKTDVRTGTLHELTYYMGALSLSCFFTKIFIIFSIHYTVRKEK